MAIIHHLRKDLIKRQEGVLEKTYTGQKTFLPLKHEMLCQIAKATGQFSDQSLEKWTLGQAFSFRWLAGHKEGHKERPAALCVGHNEGERAVGAQSHLTNQLSDHP